MSSCVSVIIIVVIIIRMHEGGVLAVLGCWSGTLLIGAGECWEDEHGGAGEYHADDGVHTLILACTRAAWLSSGSDGCTFLH